MTKLFRNIFTILAALSILIPTTPAFSSSLIVTHSSSMPPLSFINDEGQPDGLLIDFWKEWARYSGVEIIFQLQPWKKAINAVVTGEADINAGMYYSLARSETMEFGDYIYHMQGGLFASDDFVGMHPLDGKENCGVIKGDYAKIFMMEQHPFTPLTLFNSAWDMFRAAAEGRLRLFAADYPVAIYQMNKMGISDRFKCIKKLYTRNLHPTVGKHNKDLVKIINLNMAAIPKKDKEAIFRKWLDIDSSENSLGRNAIGIVGLVLLIMGYLHRTQIKVAIETLKKKLRPTT
ncbi:transporter substrate-binding domain-containing protein [Maridesulfovibrio sp.]|uniref:transporter substrate-binding domain-containing protein n=1 Tax=unclassified Maridesulfovibrio TaxID=2794999 RepID=UPI003AFF81E1